MKEVERTYYPGSSGLYHQVSGSMPFHKSYKKCINYPLLPLSLINHAVAFEILAF